jgi:hypothetical protein
MCPHDDGTEWYPFHIDTVQATDDETVMITIEDA